MARKTHDKLANSSDQAEAIKETCFYRYSIVKHCTAGTGSCRINVTCFHMYCFNLFPFIKGVINKLFNWTRISQMLWVNKIYAIKPTTN